MEVVTLWLKPLINDRSMSNKKVFVSGCYDLLHSGHVEFFKQASQYGDLYVGIGSDKTIEALKGHKTMYSEQERLFMVRAIRYVKEAYINQGNGFLDFLDPAVTRVEQPLRQASELAVDTLFRIMDARKAGEPDPQLQKLIPPTLVVRSSC
jgi:cytidyltransferase-like protein